jgi:predicted N-formylglutamate amidohydrolase
MASLTQIDFGGAAEVKNSEVKTDADFAKAMLDHLPKDTPHLMRMNARYAAADRVVHRLPKVMIKIRKDLTQNNDLIQTQREQACCAEFLAQWIKDATVVEELFT